MATLTVVPPAPPVSLYKIEQHLEALADTAAVVPAELEAEFLEEFRADLAVAAEKRDAVCHYISHLEAMAGLADAEMKRLAERKKHFENAAERLGQYVIQVIDSLGPDAKGKPRKLEGKTTTMSARACPASVNVTDESLVPTEFKSVTVTLPAPVWESLVDSLDLDSAAQLLDQIKRPSVACNKTALKAALEEGPVKGATLVSDKRYLVRK